MPEPRQLPRSYYTPEQWKIVEAARQQQAAQAARGVDPNIPVAGVPQTVWDAMSPPERAKLYADQAGQQAIVQAQRESGQRISNTLWIVLVAIPVGLVLLYLVINAASH
jgi:hypothetical protein